MKMEMVIKMMFMAGTSLNKMEKIIDYKLNDAEQAEFNKSAEAVRNMNAVLDTL
jgi:malate/lactate dehydrogenase